jgi:hypothetical protein
VAAAYFVCLTAVLPVTAAGAVTSFRITQLYSNQDGNWQFVELEEMAGKNGEDQFAGLTLSITNRYGVTKTITFATDLPSAATAGKHVTIVSQQLANDFSGFFVPDFVMPNQFLPTDGGTIDFAGIDSWTYDSLPIIWLSLLRSGVGMNPIMQNFAGGTVHPLGGFTTVYEYYDRVGDQYFMSGSQPDIDALDTGRIRGWQRTGGLFYAPSASYATGEMPVCRYYIPPASHFFSASADECDVVDRQYPQFVLETSVAFTGWLPDPATGACPPSGYTDFTGPVGLISVYRLWNNRVDTNHRYTASLDVRDQMIAQGWVSEGYGPNGVVMCVLETLDF